MVATMFSACGQVFGTEMLFSGFESRTMSRTLSRLSLCLRITWPQYDCALILLRLRRYISHVGLLTYLLPLSYCSKKPSLSLSLSLSLSFFSSCMLMCSPEPTHLFSLHCTRSLKSVGVLSFRMYLSLLLHSSCMIVQLSHPYVASSVAIYQSFSNLIFV